MRKFIYTLMAGLFFGLVISAVPAEAHPVLCSASNPCDARQVDSQGEITSTTRSCFYSNGTSDFDSVTVQNTFSAYSSRDFHLQQIRGSDGVVINGSIVKNIPYGDSYTFYVDGTGSTGNWSALPISQKNGVRIRMLWGDGSTQADWYISPTEQGHTVSGHYYEYTEDTIYFTNQWDC